MMKNFHHNYCSKVVKIGFNLNLKYLFSFLYLKNKGNFINGLSNLFINSELNICEFIISKFIDFVSKCPFLIM